MQELFFELLRVAVGQQECLSRGPSSEEWQAIADEASSQGVQGICYRGVEQLFDYGLRIPHDLALDWTADAEELKSLFKKALPDYDGDRFYVSHMKKVVEWYNELREKASLDFVEEEEEGETEATEAAE